MEFNGGKVTITIQEFDTLRDAEIEWKEFWEICIRKEFADRERNLKKQEELLHKNHCEYWDRKEKLDKAEADKMVAITVKTEIHFVQDGHHPPRRRVVEDSITEWITCSEAGSALKKEVIEDIVIAYRILPRSQKRAFLKNGNIEDITT